MLGSVEKIDSRLRSADFFAPSKKLMLRSAPLIFSPEKIEILFLISSN
jgi:hypothetical protein